jgi:flavin reductase (DIM6/NTAB) family NADH-FMN oxidoreductase RutF
MQPEMFRKLAGHWLTGVSVVTTVDQQGKPVGMTMSAVTSLSLDPPQFLICVDNRAKTLEAIVATGHFCINYLRQDQENLSTAFAKRGEDRFAALAHRVEHTGSPVLEGAIAFIECTVNAVHPGGDHTIIVGDAVNGDAPGGEPLAYFRGSYRRLESLTDPQQVWW